MTGSHGFTLMELLVVMAIIAAVVGMIVPMVGMSQYTRIQAAEQTVSIGASVARRYATRDITFEMDLNPNAAGVQKGEYTGTAVLFTPSNELRIIESTQAAFDPSGRALQLLPDGLGSDPLAKRYGYRDLQRDYIQMPRGCGVVGIVRTGDGANDIRLIAPPFVVRFNQYGQIVASHDREDRMVVYDGNYDGRYRLDRRDSNYDPAPYDPESPHYNPANFKRDANGQLVNKHVMEFELIEAVLGVIVFDKEALYDSGLDLRANNRFINDEATQWLLNPDNAKPLFFNRATGRVIRND